MKVGAYIDGKPVPDIFTVRLHGCGGGGDGGKGRLAWSAGFVPAVHADSLWGEQRLK